MLSAENNELITRVGRGAPMGDMMRRYWMPVVPANDIAADGDPQRVRLLGEDLILFRATDGQLGLVPEACPHRGVSLFFGRNEQNGLRCVYHGWKYDVSGNCVDMPSEPEESNFKNKIPAQGYAVREHGGVVWAYMGGGDPPGLPEFEWTMVPEDQRNLSIAQRHCNWLQALEGDIDTSHLFFLHGRLNPDDSSAVGVWHDDKHPRLEIVPTDYGVVYGANRDESPTTTYWRVTQFMFPIFRPVPRQPGRQRARPHVGPARRLHHAGVVAGLAPDGPARADVDGDTVGRRVQRGFAPRRDHRPRALAPARPQGERLRDRP